MQLLEIFTVWFLGIKDEKEVRGLKKKVDLLNEKNRTLEIRNQKDQQDLERIKNEKSELTKSLTRYQERIDKGTFLTFENPFITRHTQVNFGILVWDR